MIVFAAIAPHGDVDLAPEVREAMTEFGSRCTADVAIAVTPHNVHVEGHFAFVAAARVGEHDTDRELAHAIVEALRADGLPVVGVPYGGNDPAEAEMPLDEHVRARAALARATGTIRVALIASADHGHVPTRMDRTASIRRRRRTTLARADSLWQLLVLQGAAKGPAELLAYAAPTH